MTEFFLIDSVPTRPCEICGSPAVAWPARRCVECPAGTMRPWRRWRVVFVLFGLCATALLSFAVMVRFPVPFEATFAALLVAVVTFLAALVAGSHVAWGERRAWYRAWFWSEMRRWRRARK